MLKQNQKKNIIIVKSMKQLNHTSNITKINYFVKNLKNSIENKTYMQRFLTLKVSIKSSMFNKTFSIWYNCFLFGCFIILYFLSFGLITLFFEVYFNFFEYFSSPSNYLWYMDINFELNDRNLNNNANEKYLLDLEIFIDHNLFLEFKNYEKKLHQLKKYKLFLLTLINILETSNIDYSLKIHLLNLELENVQNQLDLLLMHCEKTQLQLHYNYYDSRLSSFTNNNNDNCESKGTFSHLIRESLGTTQDDIKTNQESITEKCGFQSEREKEEQLCLEINLAKNQILNERIDLNRRINETVVDPFFKSHAQSSQEYFTSKEKIKIEKQQQVGHYPQQPLLPENSSESASIAEMNGLTKNVNEVIPEIAGEKRITESQKNHFIRAHSILQQESPALEQASVKARNTAQALGNSIEESSFGQEKPVALANMYRELGLGKEIQKTENMDDNFQEALQKANSFCESGLQAAIQTENFVQQKLDSAINTRTEVNNSNSLSVSRNGLTLVSSDLKAAEDAVTANIRPKSHLMDAIETLGECYSKDTNICE